MMKLKLSNQVETFSKLLWYRIGQIIQRKRLYSEELPMPELTQRQRSVFIRHVDCGSCNGCELELNTLTNPLYDLERWGIQFESSPRHADVLAMTGPFTRSLAEAAGITLAAMSEPKKIITIGDCARDGSIFKQSYAITPKPPEIEAAIIAHVPGCPPSPTEILKELAKL